MPAKVISVINMKGGVGKTTLTANIAYGLAKFHDGKILLIDNDPQFNATQYFISTKKYLDFINNEENCTILDIYRDRPVHAISIASKGKKLKLIKPHAKNSILNVVSYTDGSKLDILPSTLDLMELDSPSLGTENKLHRFIETIKNDYDYIIIDCPPTMSVFILSAYIASDAYLIPIKPDHLSSIGISLLERAIDRYSNITGKKLEQIGIVFTMVESNSLFSDTINTLRKSRKNTFKSVMRRSVQIARAVKYNLPVFEYNKAMRDGHGKDMENIVAELYKKIK